MDQIKTSEIQFFRPPVVCKCLEDNHGFPFLGNNEMHSSTFTIWFARKYGKQNRKKFNYENERL